MKKKIVGISICTLMLIATGLPMVGAMSKPSVAEIVMWNHPPDFTSNGMAVRCDQNDGTHRILAIDFRCNITGYITTVILYGSWKNDIVGTINLIHLSIHDIALADESPTHSTIPGAQLWDGNFSDFQSSAYGTVESDWWWDPYNGAPVTSSGITIWEYTIHIPKEQAFYQNGSSTIPIYYWLDVYVKASGGDFGWRTTEHPLADDAVYYIEGELNWFELDYPSPHPLVGNSLDLACQIKSTRPVAITANIPGPVDILRIQALLTNVGDETYFNLSWSMTISGGLLWPSPPATFNGTIQSIQPNGAVPIQSGFLFGFGPIEIKIMINDNEPVIFKGFMFLFIIIYLP